MKYFHLFFAFLLLGACSTSKFAISDSGVPRPPDYANPDHWAALPSKVDNADRTPADTIPDNQATAEADVFFLHPTIYSGKRGDQPWNGPIDNAQLNKKVDESTILYQASIFNGAGRVYAPRYRQAHLSAYYMEDKDLQKEVFDRAYADVKNAFEYYLANYNNGRPIIIASHSQGTTHSKRLLREYFDDKPLAVQLVAAYLIGIPVEGDYFQHLQPCNSPNATGCFVAWRAYRRGYYPRIHQPDNNLVVVNPLTWTSSTDPAERSLNHGAVLRKFDKVYPQLAEAQVHDGLLWLERPKFPGSFLLKNPNYHIADFNFYYLNVRNNAMERVAAFLQKK
ncbi:MAG TPA: DUF3089 domain-containing protein [Saprospiraceae bacterium]|nr:DUF3089 domain-containing protein [Saprospiraceae bacterium]HMP23810.1 DUF3089 domain-containing protein [Saprospiraceae bacterium]